MAEALWMSLFEVKMIIPPDNEDRDEYSENLSGGNVLRLLLLLLLLLLDLLTSWLGSSVNRNVTL